MNIEEKILEIIRNNLSVIYDDLEITDNLNLTYELGFDSITLMQLILDIEDEFEIEFDDTDYNDINSILDLKNYIISKIKEREHLFDENKSF